MSSILTPIIYSLSCIFFSTRNALCVVLLIFIFDIICTYYSFLLVCCCFWVLKYAAYTLYRRSNSIYIIMIIIEASNPIHKVGWIERMRKTLTTTKKYTHIKIHIFNYPSNTIKKRNREEILFMPFSHVEKSFPFIFFQLFVLVFFYIKYYFS